MKKLVFFAWAILISGFIFVLNITAGPGGLIQQHREEQRQERLDLPEPEAVTNTHYRTIPAPAGLSLYEVGMPNGDVCRIVHRASKAASRSFDPAIHCKQE